MRTLVFFMCFLMVPGYSFGQGSSDAVLLICNSLRCKIPNIKNRSKSTHIGFKIEKGKKLLTELRTYRRISKKRDLLKSEREAVAKRIQSWYKLQMNQANKTADKQEKVIVNLKKERNELQKKNNKLVLDVAKYKADRSNYFLVGAAIGAGVVIVGGIATAIIIAVK